MIAFLSEKDRQTLFTATDEPKAVEKKEKCPHCGRNMTPYQVPLTKGFLAGLVKFRQAVGVKQENKIHLLKDMQGTSYELTPHEWNNFTRLRFHALVAKYKENGEHKGGYWLLTRRGAQFLNGEIEIPNRVAVFNNRVIGHSDTLVNISDVIRSDQLPYFEKINEIVYGDILQVEDEPKYE